MFRQISVIATITIACLFAGNVAQAQLGGLRIQIGGYGNGYRGGGYGNGNSYSYGNGYYGNRYNYGNGYGYGMATGQVTEATITAVLMVTLTTAASIAVKPIRGLLLVSDIAISHHQSIRLPFVPIQRLDIDIDEHIARDKKCRLNPSRFLVALYAASSEYHDSHKQSTQFAFL